MSFDPLTGSDDGDPDMVHVAVMPMPRPTVAMASSPSSDDQGQQAQQNSTRASSTRHTRSVVQDSDGEESELELELDKVEGEPLDPVVEDKDSELSDLGPTPSPPSSPFPMPRVSPSMPQQDSIPPCECTGWCTCPKHAYYPNPSPAHLPERVLANMGMSAQRSTLETRHQRAYNPERPRLPPGLDVISYEVSLRVRQLSTAPPDAKTAKRLVDSVNIHFPPPDTLLPTGRSVIERIHTALNEWTEDRKYQSLWVKLNDATHGSRDLLNGFGDFLPRKEERAWSRWTLAEMRFDNEPNSPRSLPWGWVGNHD